MLVTGLSQLLVAFTIEFDNAFESRMPHRTAANRATPPSHGPWLVSRTMWANFLRWIPDYGLTNYAPLATITNLAGLTRWGYLKVEDGRVRLTRHGLAANRIWRDLTAEIEEHWKDRWGAARIERLRSALAPSSDRTLPWALPVVGNRSTSAHLAGWSSPMRGADDELPTLMARALASAALDYEPHATVRIHVGENVLRVVEQARTRDLPALAGISREASAMSVAFLVRGGYLELDSVARLTDRGMRGRTVAVAALEAIAVGEDRESAEATESLLSNTEALAAGLVPPSDGWRAHPPYLAQTKRTLADPRGSLPHFPMVLHRGGYPDGS